MKGDLLLEYRKKAGLTQKQVGDYVGISAQGVSKWENNQSEPDIDTLCKLSELYHVPVSALIGIESTIAKTAPQPVAEGGEISHKKESFFAKNKRMLIVASLAVLIAVIAIVSTVVGLNATQASRMHKKFTKLELGMTTQEICDILGKKYEEVDVYYTEEDLSDLANMFSAAMDLKKYGYINCTFFYFRGREYKKNERNTDLNYDYKPYYQVRVTFEADKLIEAYFDYNFKYFAITDYCLNSNPKSIEYLDDDFNDELTAEKRVKILFNDDSVYLGTLPLVWQDGLPKIDAPWGEIVLNSNGQPMQVF